MKKLNKGAIWVTTGLLAGAGIGTGIGFLVLDLHEKYDAEPVHPSGLPITSTGTSNFPAIIQEYDSGIPEIQYILGKAGMDVLQDKIARRLGFGPEASMLKGIYIQKPTVFMKGTNGLYFGATNEIFINSQSIWDSYIAAAEKIAQLKDEATKIEFLAESVFQVIYHEYGHHIAYSYLNSRRISSSPVILANKASEAGQPVGMSRRWDKSFYNDFTKTLGYDSDDIGITKQSKGVVTNGTERIQALNDDYTSADLFRYANIPGVNVLHSTLNGIDKPLDQKLTYSLFGPNGSPTVNYSDSTLRYQFDMDELVTRKMMQATMSFENVYPQKMIHNNQLSATYEPSVFGGDQMVNWRIGNNTYRRMSTYGYDALSYIDDIRDTNNPNISGEAFMNDYVFNKGDNQHAVAIYNSLTKEMGYQDKDDVSFLWWENNSKIDGDGKTVLPTKTNNVKFGGFISNNDANVVGWVDAKGSFTPLSDITVSNFTYQVKKNAWGDKDAMDATKDNFTYVTNNFVDINSLKGKYLAVAHRVTDADLLNQTMVKRNSKLRKVGQKLQVGDYINIEILKSGNTEVSSFKSLNSSTETSGINSHDAKIIVDTSGVRIEEVTY